jgi:hypothetical protein
VSQKAQFLAAAKRYGSKPGFNQMAQKRYHISGPELLAKLAKGESGFSMGAVSSAGARGGTQFMPGTRADFIKRFGVDAWKNPDSAVHAAALYLAHDPRGLAGYNPGMGSYTSYILGQKVGGLKGADAAPLPGGMTAMQPGTMKVSSSFTPAGSAPDMAEAVRMVVARQAQSGKLPSIKSDPLRQIISAYRAGVATSPTAAQYSQKISTTPSKAGKLLPGDSTDLPVSAGSGKSGKVEVFGANPGRLKPSILAFARQVAGVAGETLRADSGATHSKMTVDGNVSQHWTGDAVDIPATGTHLIHLGQAALIAAGMPRKQALQQHGGLYNVGGRQIIFNTHIGGDHTNHLHLGD